MRRAMQRVTRTAFTREMARFCERSHRSCGCHRRAIAAPARREVSVECGLLPNANGSARVTLGFGATEVLAAVKVSGAGGGCGGNGGRGRCCGDALVQVELAKPSSAAPDCGFLECNVECWATVSPTLAGERQPNRVQLSR